MSRKGWHREWEVAGPVAGAEGALLPEGRGPCTAVAGASAGRLQVQSTMYALIFSFVSLYLKCILWQFHNVHNSGPVPHPALPIPASKNPESEERFRKLLDTVASILGEPISAWCDHRGSGIPVGNCRYKPTGGTEA